MSFGELGSFWLLLPLALGLSIAIPLMVLRRKRLRVLIRDNAWTAVHHGPGTGLRVLRWILFTLGAILIIFSLARPRWGHEWVDVKQRGLDMMILLDTSNSMLAEDLAPNRFRRAKWGIEGLTQELKGDRAGLVAFAGSAFLQCPLTLDYGAFLMQLEDLKPGSIPKGGTNIGAAFREALDGLGDETDSDQVFMLITDGEDHQEGLDDILKDLTKRGIRVFVIGVGSPEGELIPIAGENGSSTYLKNREGEVVKTRLNEEILKHIATETGGLYVRASSQDFGLKRVYSEGVEHLRKSELNSSRIKQYTEQYQWFLATGLLFLLFDALAPLPAFLAKRRTS